MEVNTFISYVGEAPVTVEWVLLDRQPTVTAVVLTVPKDRSLNVLVDLSTECIARFTVLARGATRRASVLTPSATRASTPCPSKPRCGASAVLGRRRNEICSIAPTSGRASTSWGSASLQAYALSRRSDRRRDAMRAIHRHGGGTVLERAFTGFQALPAPGATATWWEVLELGRTCTLAEAQDAYRRLRSKLHPDKPGSSHEAMALLNKAWADAQGALR